MEYLGLESLRRCVIAGIWRRVGAGAICISHPFAPSALPVVLPLVILPVLTSAIGLLIAAGIPTFSAGNVAR